MFPLLTESLWRDEAFSVILSAKSVFQIIFLSTQDPSPPFYYLILHFWMILFGNDEISIRLLSLLFHIGTVLIIFLIAQKLIKQKIVQILIALAILINPFLLQYAFESRAYSMVVFLSLTGLYFIKLNKNLLAGVFLAMAMFTHNFAVLTFLIVTAWWLFFNRKHFDKNEFLKLVRFPLFVIILWGGIIWMQWSKFGEGFWIPRPKINSFLSSFKIFTSGEISYPVKLYVLLSSAALFITSAIYLPSKIKSDKNNFIWLIIVVMLLPLLFTFAFSQFFTPIYYERYLILTTPLLILFIGYSLSSILLKKNYLAKIAVSTLVIFYIIFLVIGSLQILTKQTKADIRHGVKEVAKQAKPGDIIVPKNILNFLEIKYYSQRSGKNIPVYAHTSSGKVPFFIGGILYEKQDIIKELPKGKRIWQIQPNGQYNLLVL